MQAAKLPASAGWHWFSQGLAIFLYKPAPIFAWAMTVMLVLMLAVAVPPIGPLAFIVLFPALSFLSFLLCRTVIGNGAATKAACLKLLQRPGLFRQLFWLGVWYAVCNVGVAFAVLLPALSDLPEAVIDAMVSGQNVQPLLDVLRVPIITVLVLNVLTSALLWYAPALTGFCGLPAGRAMFYSVVACWRNKGAFLLYGLLFAVQYWAVYQVATLLLLLGVSPDLLNMVQIPVHAVIASVLYCSLLPSFADVFDQPPPASAAVSATSG